MNKILIFFSLFLVASICFVTIPNTVHADSQLDVLIQITQNTQAHIKKDIDKMSNVSQKIHDFYDSGAKKTSLLAQAVENEDDVSAKRYFISAMIAFKQASLAISEDQPQVTILDHGSLIKKYEAKGVSDAMKAKLKSEIELRKYFLNFFTDIGDGGMAKTITFDFDANGIVSVSA